MITGEKLRQIREEKGISLEKVAQETNIRIQFLEAIENDQMDKMASPAQAKGFARLYATFLGMDPRTVFEEEITKPDNPLDNADVKSVENPEPINNNAMITFLNVNKNISLFCFKFATNMGKTAFIKNVGITKLTSKILYGNEYKATASLFVNP